MPVPLNQFVADLKRLVLTDLVAGKLPAGEFDEALLKLAVTKNTPQMGITRYEPNRIILEYIFPDSASSPTILEVSFAPPERIVYLPVPSWVVESIWEGEIRGSFHFESHAVRLLEELQALTTPGPNAQIFGSAPSSGGRV